MARRCFPGGTTLTVLMVIGLHYGLWLIFTTRMAPRLPVPRAALMVQLIATPVQMTSDSLREPEQVPARSHAPAPASAVSPLSRLPAQPVVDIREVLPDDLPQDTVGQGGYRGAQQVDQRARALIDLLPVYPQPAFKRREHGRVLVEILIDAQGGVDTLRLLAATAGFAESALAAFDGMHFDPAMLGGRPVPSRLLVELTYRLSEHIDASEDR
ncbi:MAG: TonB family protein [Bradyrhizobium sp.]|jgi:TonB family protein